MKTDRGLETLPFPAPGSKWRPLHRTPHGNNKTISIRRFISLAKEKKHESI
jgi:hypothetical protein